MNTTISDPVLRAQALAAVDRGVGNLSTVFGANMGNYQLLEQIPGSSETVGRLDTYLRDIYIFAFWAVGIAVVFMLTIGGFMYLTSAGNTSRMESAKTVIFDAILGLVLALVAWLFLYVINPDLVNLNLRAVSITPISSTAAPAATTPTPGVPTTPSTGATGCGGLATRGISPSQCGDASPQLSDLLACIQSRYPSAQVNSISDSAGFSQCKNNWTDPVCAHGRTSCHYGGGSSKTAPECQRSHGADLSTRNASGGVDGNIATAIMAAAQACGGRVNNEGDHIHVSTQTSCCTL
ncbi:MAG: pilin [Candidatus Moraniibacteriota bacterium]